MLTRPPQGIGEAFGIAFESTFGTPVSPTIWWRPVSNSLQRRDPLLPMTGATGSSVQWTASGNASRGFRGRPDISGTVVLEAEYTFIGYLFQNAIAAGATPVNADTSAYQHVFTLPATMASTVPKSFTAARVIDETGVEMDTQFSGCMIDALEISGAENRIVTVSADIVAQGGGNTHVIDDIGTLSASPWIEFHECYFRADTTATGTTLTDSHDQKDGAEVIDWTVRIENGYRRQQAAGNGVRGDREYTFAGYRGVTLTVNRDFFDDNFFDEYHAAAESNMFGTYGIRAISDQLAGAASQKFELGLTLNAGHVETSQEYPGGPDVLGETITIRAGDNGTDAPLVAELWNTKITQYV